MRVTLYQTPERFADSAVTLFGCQRRIQEPSPRQMEPRLLFPPPTCALPLVADGRLGQIDRGRAADLAATDVTASIDRRDGISYERRDSGELGRRAIAISVTSCIRKRWEHTSPRFGNGMSRSN